MKTSLPAMEPDLIGQEKTHDGCPATTTAMIPQWSLTSSVRKSSRQATHAAPTANARNGA